MKTMIEEIIRTAEYKIQHQSTDESTITVIVSGDRLNEVSDAMCAIMNMQYQCSVTNLREIEEFYEQRAGRRLVNIIARPKVNNDYQYMTLHSEGCGHVNIIYLPELLEEDKPIDSAGPRKDPILRNCMFVVLVAMSVLLTACMLGELPCLKP